MLLQLLAHIIGEPCFNVLRTQEQLGYIVFSHSHKANMTLGLKIIVQSDKHPQYVEKRIDLFVNSMLVSTFSSLFASSLSSSSSSIASCASFLYIISYIMFQDYISEMSDEKFERHKDSLATLRLEKPKKLFYRTNMFWSEILSQKYNFDRVNIEVAYLKTITREQLFDFFKVLPLTF